jgi:hypothetical protein
VVSDAPSHDTPGRPVRPGRLFGSDFSLVAPFLYRRPEGRYGAAGRTDARAAEAGNARY